MYDCAQSGAIASNVFPIAKPATGTATPNAPPTMADVPIPGCSASGFVPINFSSAADPAPNAAASVPEPITLATLEPAPSASAPAATRDPMFPTSIGVAAPSVATSATVPGIMLDPISAANCVLGYNSPEARWAASCCAFISCRLWAKVSPFPYPAAA